MNKKPELSTQKKIFFFREQVSGYPPEEWESMWAKQISDRVFQLDNIPFFAINVSFNDKIVAELINDQFIFDKVLEKSDNSTIRIFVKDINEVDTIWGKLSEIECEMEKSGIAGLIAVNVPKASMALFNATIEIYIKSGKIEVEVGVLR